MAGAFGSNVAAASASLVEIGGLYLLTLPIDVTMPFFIDGSQVATFRYEGVVSAVAPIPVPEPSSLALAALGLAALAGLGRRR